MLKQYLAVGEIVSLHGVRGELRVKPWCDGPEFLKNFKYLYFDAQGKEKVTVLSARPHGNITLLKLDGTDTAEKAQALRGRTLYIDRRDASLPENSWFIEDLIGCKVIELDTEKTYGTITDVMKMPANDVWTVRGEDGKETLIPAIKSVVIKTEVENGVVYIKALKGLFDGGESVREDEN